MVVEAFLKSLLGPAVDQLGQCTLVVAVLGAADPCHGEEGLEDPVRDNHDALGWSSRRVGIDDGASLTFCAAVLHHAIEIGESSGIGRVDLRTGQVHGLGVEGRARERGEAFRPPRRADDRVVQDVACEEPADRAFGILGKILDHLAQWLEDHTARGQGGELGGVEHLGRSGQFLEGVLDLFCRVGRAELVGDADELGIAGRDACGIQPSDLREGAADGRQRAVGLVHVLGRDRRAAVDLAQRAAHALERVRFAQAFAREAERVGDQVPQTVECSANGGLLPPARPQHRGHVTPEADQLAGVGVLVIGVQRPLPGVLEGQLALDTCGGFHAEDRPGAWVEDRPGHSPGQYPCTLHDRGRHAVAGFHVVEVAVLVLDRCQSVVGVVRHLAQSRTDLLADGPEDGRARRLGLVLRGGVGLALARLRDGLGLECCPSCCSDRDGGARVLFEFGRGAHRVGDGLGDRGRESGSLGSRSSRRGGPAADCVATGTWSAPNVEVMISRPRPHQRGHESKKNSRGHWRGSQADSSRSPAPQLGSQRLPRHQSALRDRDRRLSADPR